MRVISCLKKVVSKGISLGYRGLFLIKEDYFWLSLVIEGYFFWLDKVIF